MNWEVDILDTSLLSFDGDFDGQVQEILQFVRLTAENVKGLQGIFNDLEKALQQLVPGCQIMPFGSIVSGLGIKTSDVDCYVHLPYGIAPSVRHITGARNIMKCHYQIFAEIMAITSAKVPIVKFVHRPTNFQCDVNFHSPIGVHNSQLIAFLLQWDKRALPLAVIIKYWSKVHRFTGTNLLANYSLIMMLIFYLQTLRILPSVYDLQRDMPPDYIENWNAAFDNTMYNDSVTSDLSLYELLGGFFMYYSTFNYQQNVISPYLGRIISRNSLEDVDSLPEEFSLYKNQVSNEICLKIRIDTKICLQDPFQHNKNCTVAIYEKLANKIISLFKFASKKFEEDPVNSFLKSIFTQSPCIILPPRAKPKGSKNNEQKVHVIQKNIFKPIPKKGKRGIQTSFDTWFIENRKTLKGKR